ncbi:ATP-binding cassette domain-containing protein [Microbacterium cremeum]|uniref:ATP-binding cassette domain-containing protein n=1 Tax=Microbacterium cremeum TaxID=2782169 RepID=UPI001887FA65
MPDGQSLEFSGVTKRFGAITAVAGLTARIEPGRVTGFLGPNGAGKTTTLRILLGLVRATDGRATIGGKRYAELAHPLQTVGAVLEASSFHPGRTAAAHLKVYAQAAGIANGRVDEVLGLVGLTHAAGRKVGGFSLGMRQRLGLAYALLGDPGVLVLDEPANGLDPEGIRWMRGFLRDLAREGRTVLVSSHLLAEVQQTADALLIISLGRLVFQGTLDELADPSEHATVVDSPDRAGLSAALQAAGVPFEVLRSGLTVRGVEPAAVGAVAAAGGVALSSLHRRGPALEEVFLDLVNGVRVHPSAAGVAAVEVARSLSEGAPATDTNGPEPTDDTDAEAFRLASLAQRPDPEPEPDADARSLSEGAPATETKHPEPTDDTDPEAFRLASLAQRPDPEPETDDTPRSLSEGAPATETKRPEPTDDTDPEAFRLASLAQRPDPDPETEPDPAPRSLSEGAPATETKHPEPADDTEPEPETGTGSAAFAVASTGIIDVVPPAQSDPDGPPPDPDPDVEELGAVDEELSVPEPAEDDDARPWESREKTDADLEADRFFAAFDAGDEEPGREPEAEASVDEEGTEEPASDDEEGTEEPASVDEEGAEEPAPADEEGGDER